MEDWKDKLEAFKEQARIPSSIGLCFELPEPHFERLTALDDEIEVL